MNHIGGIGLIDACRTSITVVGVVERRTVTVLLRAVVLCSAKDHRIRSRVLRNELVLGDAQTLIDSVIPGGAAIRGLVDPSIVASINHKVIGWMKPNRMIVMMYLGADLRGGPRTVVTHSLIKRDAG